MEPSWLYQCNLSRPALNVRPGFYWVVFTVYKPKKTIKKYHIVLQNEKNSKRVAKVFQWY